MSVIFEKIVSICKKRNISISKLEKECGLGNGTVKGWESSQPRIDSLKKVADYFSVTVQYFLE